MQSFSLSHLSDGDLDLATERSVGRVGTEIAWHLAHIAESDARRRYLPKGYASMSAYCIQHLGLTEDVALKHIQAARVAHRFPAVFEALADGRLHVSGVCELARWLTSENAPDLLEAAMRRTRAQIR